MAAGHPALNIRPALVSTGPGRGEIRAHLGDADRTVLTVGDYSQGADVTTWSARLRAKPGDPVVRHRRQDLEVSLPAGRPRQERTRQREVVGMKTRISFPAERPGEVRIRAYPGGNLRGPRLIVGSALRRPDSSWNYTHWSRLGRHTEGDEIGETRTLKTLRTQPNPAYLPSRADAERQRDFCGSRHGSGPSVTPATRSRAVGALPKAARRCRMQLPAKPRPAAPALEPDAVYTDEPPF